MNLNISVSLEMDAATEGPILLQIEATGKAGGRQTLETSTLSIAPFTNMELYTDALGNNARRFLLSQGHSHIEYQARVTLNDERAPLLPPFQADVLSLPPETLLYLLPSRYCPSDLMTKMAGDLFGLTEPGYPQVQAVCAWIYEHVTYQYGTSDSATTATDTLLRRVGVCRDFAHLAVAFCRALNIPTRYVSGYCLGLEQPDFHAYIEAFVSGRWVAFDATASEPRRALVQVAVGRDAADCAWGTFYGEAQTTSMMVDVQEVK